LFAKIPPVFIRAGMHVHVQGQERGLKNQTYLPAGRLKTQKQKQKLLIVN
jgi:hypothetical protein